MRELLLAGRRRVHEILLASDLDPAPVLDDIRELAAEGRVPVREVSRGRLEAQARTDAPQGVVAHAAELPEADLDDLARPRPGGRPPFLVALDGVTDPGNLGALLRSAEGAGATGIVLPKHRSVHVTPAAAKAAAGAIEHLPIALVGGLPAALARLRELGVWVVGLDGVGRPAALVARAGTPSRWPSSSGPRGRAWAGWSGPAATRWWPSRWPAGSGRSTWPRPAPWPASRWPAAGPARGDLTDRQVLVQNN